MPALIQSSEPLPEPGTADARGLVAIGGDLSVPRLLEAYRRGIFPWDVDPVTWWSPDPRGIFEWDSLHRSRSLERTLRRQCFQVTFDQAFTAVMRGCAARAPGRYSTWIHPAMITAYTNLHLCGHAHSVECWQSGVLVGGIYGVAIGGLFAGESMFHRVGDASKVALVHLTDHLREKGFSLFDIQMVTPATQSLGATWIPRTEYLKRLAAAAAKSDCRF